jgi:5'-methylthioadenosine phosphorylase
MRPKGLSKRPFLGVIGSFEFGHSGLARIGRRELVETPYGVVEAAIGEAEGARVALLTRPGPRHPLSPHAINHRANVAALVELGVDGVVATGMVGSLRPSLPVGTMLVLDQFLDFTKRHPCTFYDEDDFAFLDFTDPFCPRMRRALVRAAEAAEIELAPQGCYVTTDGPRYETAAEVRMFALLGGDVVGQTISTECVMAREAGLCYAAVAGVVNVGAGLSERALSADDFLAVRTRHLEAMERLFRTLLAGLGGTFGVPDCTCATAPERERQRPPIPTKARAHAAAG